MFRKADVEDKNSAAEIFVLEGILEDIVSDNISMVFLSSQHRTTKYGAWHYSLITDWPPSSPSQVEPAEIPFLHTVTSMQHIRYIYHSWVTSTEAQLPSAMPKETQHLHQPIHGMDTTLSELVRDCSARYSVGTDFSLQRLLAKTKSELGLSSHHCSLLLDTFTDGRNDSLWLLRLRLFSTKQ